MSDGRSGGASDEPPRMSARCTAARYDAGSAASKADGRLYSPSFERNYAPIRERLAAMLAGAVGTVLEIGSGTGQHVAHLACDLPHLHWQPTDIDADHLASTRAWRAHVGAPKNLHAPLHLDATGPWKIDRPLAAVYTQNVIHIAPWAVAEGIVAGAARTLAPGGRLIFYGPFREGGRQTGDGNARFDAALRARDPAWGVRDADDVAALAVTAGFGPPELHRMPSNNRILAFSRS